MTTNDSIEARLTKWSIDATADFRRTFGKMPGRWLQMEAEYGTRGAVNRLMAESQESWWTPILGHLWEAGRLQWSAEAMVLMAESRETFTVEERAVARARLLALGYDGDVEGQRAFDQ
jgi:hypothetical protein